MQDEEITGKVALITGGAQRIGAAIARTLHLAGMNLALHYRDSALAAQDLCNELEGQRPNSVLLVQGNLLETTALITMVGHAVDRWGRLDALVNNAARFYSTPVASATNVQWEDLMGSNLKAPFFLAQAAAPFLAKVGGTIINIIDIHGSRPKPGHLIYSVSKAGLSMLTQALAQELGPDVRVNGVSPGAILWPEQELAPTLKDAILDRLVLKHLGRPQDIAQSVLFLIRDGQYITGQIITVDGGRSLTI